MGKEKGAIAVASEKTGKSEQVVRNFIKKHPELGIVKNASNRFIITDEQMAALCNAFEELEAEKKRREASHRMTQKEQDDWLALCKYIEEKVMGYTDKVLSKNMCIRLKGMRYGKQMGNNKLRDRAKYSYQVILNTVKYSMPAIRTAMSKNSFSDENHKFNYAMRIVDGNLNTVAMSMERAEKAKREIEEAKPVVAEHKAAEYRPPKKNKKKDKFKTLF